MYKFIVILCLLNGVTGYASRWGEIGPEAPEDGIIENVLQELGNDPEIILKPLRESKALCSGFRYPHTLQVSWENRNAKATDAECIGCQLMMTIIKQIVGMGCVYEDVKSILLTGCLFILNRRGLSARTMCEPILDNYGPAFWQIATLSQMLPTEGCTYLHYCMAESIVNVPAKPLIPKDMPVPQPPSEIISQEDDYLRIQQMSEHVMQQTFHGIQKRATEDDLEGAFKIVQLSDIHVDEEYASGAATDCGLPLCCRSSYSGTGSAGPNGEMNCNVPPSTTIKVLNKIAELEPDLVLYTGDSPSHHLWAETLEKQMNSTLLASSMLAEAFPDSPIYSTIGNHENFPTNMYLPGGDRPETDLLHQTFINAYGDLGMLEAEQEETIKLGGYYTKLLMPGLRLLAYNSNFGYTDNWFNVVNYNGDVYKGMLEWMEDTLLLAQENDEKVIVITHHPNSEGILQYDHDIKNIIMKYTDIIKLHVCGHKHKESWQLYRDPLTDKAVHVQILAQSSNTYNTVNPGARIYYFDNETMELIDFHQYYLDVAHDNTVDAEVKLSYKMKEEYGMNDLNPESWQTLTHRMVLDNALFNKYIFNKRTKNAEVTCTGACHKDNLCHMNAAALDEYYACLKADFYENPETTTDPNNNVPTEPNGSSQLSPIWIFVAFSITIQQLVV